MSKKNLTRHNGRSGKNGAYNPKHNDRRFDVENSEYIDAERAKRNVYWDCYQGFHHPKAQIKEPIKKSLLDRLAKAQVDADAYNAARRAGWTEPRKNRDRYER